MHTVNQVSFKGAMYGDRKGFAAKVMNEYYSLPASQDSLNPNWKPNFPHRIPGRFCLADKYTDNDSYALNPKNNFFKLRNGKRFQKLYLWGEDQNMFNMFFLKNEYKIPLNPKTIIPKWAEKDLLNRSGQLPKISELLIKRSILANALVNTGVIPRVCGPNQAQNIIENKKKLNGPVLTEETLNKALNRIRNNKSKLPVTSDEKKPYRQPGTQSPLSIKESGTRKTLGNQNKILEYRLRHRSAKPTDGHYCEGVFIPEKKSPAANKQLVAVATKNEELMSPEENLTEKPTGKTVRVKYAF